MDQTQVEKVAFEFGEVLRNWLTQDELDEVVLRNANECVGDDICASHDFCDANMAMNEAFHNLGLKTMIDYEDQESPEADAALDLWNAAWTMAKAANFRVEVTQ